MCLQGGDGRPGEGCPAALHWHRHPAGALKFAFPLRLVPPSAMPPTVKVSPALCSLQACFQGHDCCIETQVVGGELVCKTFNPCFTCSADDGTGTCTASRVRQPLSCRQGCQLRSVLASSVDHVLLVHALWTPSCPCTSPWGLVPVLARSEPLSPSILSPALALPLSWEVPAA